MIAVDSTASPRRPAGFGSRLAALRWPFVFLVALIAAAGYAALYSAGGGEHGPWAWRHGVRFGVGCAIMLGVALIDLRWWFRLALPIYLAVFAALVAVEIAGEIGKGAQRWIDLGPLQLQPSELMKIALVLALARVLHGIEPERMGNPLHLLLPAALVLAPVALVLRQPDLGTAVMLAAGGGAVIFLAGVRLWMVAAAVVAGLAALPIAWSQLHDYQRQRVLTFLDPENDPLGSGYHIIQSKIALGSGGLWGRGFLHGTQSQLNFLPEKQTDFVFTLLAEETGLVGALLVLGLYLLVILYGLAFAIGARSPFARLLAGGLSATFSLYVLINVAMVTGLIPVVGVPLPLVSYGGTAMLTATIAFGLLLSIDLHKGVVSATGADDG